MRSCWLVPGDILDRASCSWEERMENDGPVFSVDVSHLWYGRMYWTYIQKLEKDPCRAAGRFIYDRDLCGRIQHRVAVETLRYVSLGLQQLSSEL